MSQVRRPHDIDIQAKLILLLVVEEFGKCVDCTSNQVFLYVSLMSSINIEQYEYYTELSKPARKDILEKALELALNLHDQFPEVTFEELAVEVAVR